MSSLGRRLRREIKQLDPGGYYQDRACLWPVSKDLRGELRGADQERQQCAELDCLTLKRHVRLKARIRSHAPCDSIMSRSLDGDIEGEIVFACLEDGHRRGYHIGKIKWVAGDSTLVGQLSGVTNAGTHRRPLSDWEPYDRRGHMEGRLDAVSAKGDHNECRFVAAYAIDFDPGSQFQNTGFLGTLEGVLICNCRR